MRQFGHELLDLSDRLRCMSLLKISETVEISGRSETDRFQMQLEAVECNIDLRPKRTDEM